MTFGPGHLYYVDYSDTIGRIDLQTKSDETLLSGLNNPSTIRYDEGSNMLYFLEKGSADEEYKDGTLKVISLNQPPTISILSPITGSEHRSSTMDISWNYSDIDSGIERCEVRIDDEAWIDVGTNTHYVFSSIGDGEHTVEVRVFNKYNLSNEDSTTFTVNTSLIGGPGWMDDTAILVTAAGIVIGLVALTITRKKKSPS